MKATETTFNHNGRKVRVHIPTKEDEIRDRLEYIRHELRQERISYGELIELQTLTGYIDPGDVELLEAAGVPEFNDM